MVAVVWQAGLAGVPQLLKSVVVYSKWYAVSKLRGVDDGVQGGGGGLDVGDVLFGYGGRAGLGEGDDGDVVFGFVIWRFADILAGRT